MGSTKIEWAEHSWNPVRGCTRISRGCGGPGPHGGCYAEAVAARFSGPGQPYEGLAEMRDGKPRWTGKLTFVESALLAPLRRKTPTIYFVNSMSDLFHEDMPVGWIDKVFAVMALCPQHTFHVLTKRPSRMRAYIGDPKTRKRIWTACHSIAVAFPDRLIQFMAAAPGFALHVQEVVHQAIFPEDDEAASIETLGWPLLNVWLGTSVEDQPTADARIPDLLSTTAAVRFVSAEPLVGPLTFRWALWTTPGRWNRNELDSLRALDWIIVGGESGPRARPMHPAWARAIRDQCAAAGVPFFFKQWGLWSPYLDPVIQEADGSGEPDIAWPDGTFAWGSANEHGGLGQAMQRVGKKRAGRLLDGVEHNAMPARAAA